MSSVFGRPFTYKASLGLKSLRRRPSYICQRLSTTAPLVAERHAPKVDQ